DPAQRDKLLDIVAQDVTRLDRLLSEIADASRIDTEMSRAETRAVELDGVLTVLAEMHRPAFAAERLRLTLDMPEAEAFQVFAVEDRLGQGFQNLLNNARSFSPPGGEITIRVAREDGVIRIDFDDEGPGIAEERREAIFDRFHTLRPESEPFGAHSGLGLSISRQIIDAHGGTIQCTSRAGESGARFTIRLPAATGGGS
ncbi:MAG: histidine kinase, partial [Rhodospirillaceae bacterium]|nr:histidine kinase [Rhodospirillaceae bacterium]